MTAQIRAIYNMLVSYIEKAEDLPIVLARLTMGWIFLTSGWGKLHNLESVIGFFESIGIPFANIQAPFVAGLELVGGAALLVGLATRFFSLQLAGVMAVAILTAHLEDIDSFAALFKVYEFSYLIMLLFLLTKGGGSLAVDRVLKTKI